MYLRQIPWGIESFNTRELLVYYYQTQQVIPEVFVRNTAGQEGIDLVGVRVRAVSASTVIFQQVVSPGAGLVSVRIRDIIGIDLPN